jgi:hypothetical protein
MPQEPSQTPEDFSDGAVEDFSDGAVVKAPKPTTSNLPTLTAFANQFGYRVGSTTKGRHNAGSLHRSGNAIDIGHEGVDYNELVKNAEAYGLRVRDERAHPKGQRVWTGPHFHVETDPSKENFSDGAVGAANQSSGGPGPNPGQPELPTTGLRTPAVQATPDALHVEQIAANTPPLVRRRTPKPSGPFAGLQAGIGGNAPDTGMGAIRQADEREVKRRQRIQSSVARDQQVGEDFLSNRPHVRNPQVDTANEVNRRITDEQRAEELAAEGEAWNKANRKKIDQQVDLYRKDIRANGHAQWLGELQAKAASQLAELGAGSLNAVGSLTKQLGSKTADSTLDTANEIRIRAAAAAEAAQIEGAGRSEVSKTIQDIAGGFIGGSPELLLMSLGIPGPVVFGASGGLKARGTGKPVLPATAHGVGTGAAFEIPGVGKGLKRAVTKAGAVGAGTTAVDVAAGVPIGEAIKSGAVNALMAGVPEAFHGARRAKVTEPIEMRPRTKAEPISNNDFEIAGKPKVRISDAELRVRQKQAQEASDKLLELGVIDHKQAYEAVKKASTAVEAEPKSEDITSLRRVDINEDRRALGQPEFTAPEKKTWQKTYDIAQQKGYVSDARAISEGVLKKEGAALSDEQAAGINMRLAQLKNEHKAALAKGDGDKVDSVENEFNLLQTASDKAGSETARALNIRKATLNSDYELITLLQRAKAKGIDVTPAKRTEYKEMSAKIADLESQLDTAHLAPVQAKLDQISRIKVRAETRAKLDVEYQSLKQALAAEFRVKVQSAGLAGLDPEGKRTAIITKIIRNRVKAGYVDAVGLLDEVHGAVRGYGLSRADIKEYIRAEMETSPADRRRQTQLFKQEADFTRRLEQKDFSKQERTPVVYNKETVRLQGAIDKLKAQYETELHNAAITRKQKWAQYAFDTAMIPKSVMSSADLSAPLRQGAFHSLSHPIISAKAFAQSIAGITDVGHAKLKARIENHPDYSRAVKAGVEFTGLDNPSVREEHYISNLTAKAPILKHSERAFTGFLDTQRLQVFSKLSEGVKDPKALKAVGDMINIASGRAHVRQGGPLAKGMYGANLAFYSPRLVASRFQLLNKMLNPVAMRNMPGEVRARLIADNIKFVGVVATTMTLARAAGMSVSMDPDSPDFLKLRFEDTRYDILAGLQQPMRLLINSTRAIRNYANGTPSKKSAGELVGRFARSKLAPESSYLIDWLNESDYLGRPFSHKSALASRLTPMVLSDMYDAMKNEGFLFSEPVSTAKQGAKGILKASPSVLGVGEQTYGDKAGANRPHYRI